jgi:hypothetical protein
MDWLGSQRLHTLVFSAQQHTKGGVGWISSSVALAAFWMRWISRL